MSKSRFSPVELEDDEFWNATTKYKKVFDFDDDDDDTGIIV